MGFYGLKHQIVEISGDVTDAGRTDKQTTTSEDRATQLLICATLSFAIREIAELPPPEANSMKYLILKV